MSHISDRVVALTAAASARDTVRPRPPRQAHAARLRSRFGWADATPEFSMPRREKRWQPRMDWAISGRGWLCFLPCRAWTMGHVYSIYIYIYTHSLTHSLVPFISPQLSPLRSDILVSRTCRLVETRERTEDLSRPHTFSIDRFRCWFRNETCGWDNRSVQNYARAAVQWPCHQALEKY
jgi:hypothetical protein